MTLTAHPTRARRSPSAAPTTLTSAYASTIRTAVATLALAPPEVLRATSVTGRLSGGADEARLLTALSHDLAERAGLVADVRVDGAVFHVRLCRLPMVVADVPRPADGWLLRLLRRWIS